MALWLCWDSQSFGCALTVFENNEGKGAANLWLRHTLHIQLFFRISGVLEGDPGTAATLIWPLL